MSKYASEVVKQAQVWLGAKEGGAVHKEIIDIYNSQSPLPRGYEVKYTDAWCATFVSAVAIKLGYTDIIPTECGCEPMLELFKKLGCFIENENRTPNIGEIIFYDWADSGSGDNKGRSDHVGIVEKVSGGKITVIEGNYSNSVKRRTLAVNGKYIRGYGVPKYDAEVVSEDKEVVSEDKAAVKENTVLGWQKAAIADGYKFPKYGADGEWGAECESVAKKAICKKPPIGKKYTNKNLTKFIQRQLGFVGDDVDGLFGKKTEAAVEEFQVSEGFEDKEVDGIVGINTWKRILGV